MDLLPHPPIYLSEIRPLDIFLLLAIGMGWECISRFLLLSFKIKPKSLRTKEAGLAVLQRETKRMRDMGPSKFVETSKLERQVLAKEREIDEIRKVRKRKEEGMEKVLTRYGSYVVTFAVFALYYGVPLLSLEVSTTTVESLGDEKEVPGPTFRTIFFPISYFGLGMRIARWGLLDASNSIGALVVLWSGQVVAEKLMDAVAAIMLQ